jgi:hypothetical protein
VRCEGLGRSGKTPELLDRGDVASYGVIHQDKIRLLVVILALALNNQVTTNVVRGSSASSLLALQRLERLALGYCFTLPLVDEPRAATSSLIKSSFLPSSTQSPGRYWPPGGKSCAAHQA